MRKIPCLFRRDFTTKPPTLLRDVTPGCEWVLAGEGVATRKWDGTACMVSGGKLYARLDCKNGKTPPQGAIPCDPEPDPVTGHWPHWVEATRPEDRWIRVAFERATAEDGPRPDGTYEAIGPRINGNAEHETDHTLWRHGTVQYFGLILRDFDGLRDTLARGEIEGFVFHHPDGRMAKIRRDDFGFPWPVPETP